MKGAIVVKVDKCMGCKACEIACAIRHSVSQDLATAIHENPLPQSAVTVEQGNQYATPLQCRQCADAPCVAVCPTHALNREDKDSPVVMDYDKCIGCQLCVLACPFGVIRLDEQSHAIVKCDQCAERVKAGQLPACVTACPTGALEFETMESVIDAKKSAFLLTIERCTEKPTL